MDEGLWDLFDVVMDVLPGLIIVLVIASIVFGFTRTGLFGAIFGSNSKRRSAPGVGIVRSKRQTGVYINENPQFEIEADLVRADGSVVCATLRQVVPLGEMHLVDEGVALPVRYDPEDPTDVALADDVDPALAQDIAARHRARTHPGDMPIELYRRISSEGVERWVRLDELRLTGRMEGGDYEARMTVTIEDDAAGDQSMSRTLYVSERALRTLVVGGHVKARLIPGVDGAFVVMADLEAFL